MSPRFLRVLTLLVLLMRVEAAITVPEVPVRGSAEEGEGK